MTRIHIHVSVGDLAKSIGFYSTLFGAENGMHLQLAAADAQLNQESEQACSITVAQRSRHELRGR